MLLICTFPDHTSSPPLHLGRSQTTQSGTMLCTRPSHLRHAHSTFVNSLGGVKTSYSAVLYEFHLISLPEVQSFGNQVFRRLTFFTSHVHLLLNSSGVCSHSSSSRSGSGFLKTPVWKCLEWCPLPFWVPTLCFVKVASNQLERHATVVAILKGEPIGVVAHQSFVWVSLCLEHFFGKQKNTCPRLSLHCRVPCNVVTKTCKLGLFFDN